LARKPPPPVGHGLLIHELSRSHTTTHHSRYDSSGRVISSSQRTLPDNTQHLQQTNIHTPGGIRTHNLKRRPAADRRLRPRGHWDRRFRTVKEQVKFTLDQATKTQRRSRGIALLFLEPAYYMSMGGQNHAPTALPPGKRPGTHCTGSCVGPTDGLDMCGKSRPTGIRSPYRPACSESLY